MFRSKFIRLLFCIAFLFAYGQASAQCNAQEKGKNIIQNPGFELGDTLFSSPLASKNKCENNSCRGWSEPGEYWVSGNIAAFNPDGNFSGSPRSGNNVLMVDADCNPGGSVWEQTVYVYPNTNYYFSVWIATLHPISPAQLSFEVNGVTLGKRVDAPAVTNKWLFYEDEWNSGELEGYVQLKIKEQSGVNCGNGDDFAIDDISFIPGCEFGAPGPIVDLGEDISICGSGGKLTLNSGIAAQNNVTFLWNTGETTPTIEVSAPGIYYICVDSVSACPRSDVIEVLNDYSIGLQSDVDLCNPATVTLDPGYAAQGVTYKWFKDEKVLSGQKAQELVVNTPGKYVVEVNEPICGIRTDTINVTSSAAIAVNEDFCPPAPAPTLSIIGSGNYLWYDSPALDNEIAVGTTYTPIVTETTTYYVKDTSSFVKRIGELTKLSTDYGSGGQYDQGFEVNVLMDVLWDSVSVYPVSWNVGTGNLAITIYDVTDGGKTQVDQIIHSVSLPNNGGNPTEDQKIQVKVGFEFIGGKKYVVTNEGSSAQFAFHQSGQAPTYPYSIPGFISINKLVNQHTQVYGVFYDWVVVVGSPCKPVPVVARAYCPPIPICTMPEFVQLAYLDGLCGENKMLKARVTPSENYEYEFFRNGSSIQQGSSDSLKVTQEGTYEVLVTDPIKSDLCFLPSGSIIINEFSPYYLNVEATPKVSIIDLGNSAFIGAEVEGFGPFKYMWLDENTNAISSEETISVSPILIDGGTVNYYIQVTDVHGCTAIDTAFVNVTHVPLFIPNLITPNNDNKNDYFVVTGITPGTKISISNRWGQVVYTSENYDNSWKADNVSDGIYYVLIELGLTNEVYKSWLQVLNKED